MDCILFVKMHQVFSKKPKDLKNTGNWEEILVKSGEFVISEKWEPWFETQKLFVFQLVFQMSKLFILY